MPSRRLRALIAISLALSSTSLAAERFEESVSVQALEIPVTVLRHGDPVRGLSADDFEVSLAGEEVPISDFEVFDLEQPSAAQAPGPTTVAGRRHLLLLFDLAFSDPLSVVRARRAALGILGDLHPSDLVAVGILEASSGIEMLLSFTPDRDQAALAIETLGTPELLHRRSDPLGLALGQGSGEGPEDIGARTTFRGFDADPEVTEYLQRAAGPLATDQAEERHRILQLARSLEDLAGYLSARDGRKLVVFLSEGFDSTLMLGEREEDVATRSALESGELWNVDNSLRHGDTRLQNEFERALEALRGADCAVQSVDIGNFGSGASEWAEQRSRRQGLLALASDTGGQLIENFQDLGEAMDEVLTRSSVTYLLVVQLERRLSEEEDVRLKVRLRNPERGTRVLHRSSVGGDRGPAAEALDAAALLLSGRSGGDLDVELLSAAFDRPEGSYVPVLLEVGGRELCPEAREARFEVFVYAIGKEGKIADFLSQQIALKGTAVSCALPGRGLKLWGHLDLAAGEYSLRVLVRETGSGLYGLRVGSLTVPEFLPGEELLLPPLIADTDASWLLVEESEDRRRRTRFPFLVDGEPFVPAVKREVEPGEELDFHLAAYGWPDEEPRLTAYLVSQEGEGVEASRVVRLGRSRDPDGLLWTGLRMKIPEASPGDYLLVVEATRPSSGSTSSSSVALRIAPEAEGAATARRIDELSGGGGLAGR